MHRLTQRTVSLSTACALCMLLTACAAPQTVQHIPMAVECPPMPRPPAPLMQPLPTIDLIPPDMRTVHGLRPASPTN